MAGDKLLPYELIGAPAVQPLMGFLREKGAAARVAGNALGEIGAPAVALVVAALQDRDGGMRMMAAYALGKTLDEGAVAPLIAALADASTTEAAAEALGTIRHPRAIPPLLRLMKNPASPPRRARR